MFLGVGKQAHDDQSHHDQSGYQVLRHGCHSGHKRFRFSAQDRADAPHDRGAARLLSDCNTAAVEAREGEAVEGLSEGGALVPQHADSHFLADRH
jgi:hypothetical protein